MTDGGAARLPATSSARSSAPPTASRGWPHLMPLWFVVRGDGHLGLDLRQVPEGPQPGARPAGDAADRGRRELRPAARGDARGHHGAAPRHRRRWPRSAPSSSPATAAASVGAEVDEAILAQARKRVALQFVARAHGHLGSPQARRHLLSRTRFAHDARTQGPDPVRRQGHPPAPDHPHQRQAAGPGRQPAGAVLRHPGDGRRRHRGGRDHHRPRDRRRDPRGRPATARASGCGSPTSSRTSPPGWPTPCSPPSPSWATRRSSCTWATTCSRAGSGISCAPSTSTGPTP